jgi:hypothetical protein
MEVLKMKKRVLLVSIFLFLGVAWVIPGPMEIKADAEGRGTPLITQSFASKQIGPNDTWKVYLKASHPDGKMKNIFSLIEQPGVGTYSASITRIKEENRKELSGYIYLNTLGPGNQLNFVNLTLTVQIQDMAGHFSAPAVFPLSIYTRFTQEGPPQGVFKEQDLGPIMIRLSTIDGGVSGDFGQ